ncbi:unnamed protein product [Ranitomeya imitator]|uniref:Uncharacterized protein n=1 Tax=Ranitomeya imitator TaxID=111125 RepID=A0ABN9MDF5_9NEOB|nr:unnamed protein product [Ranitomeya imitator]
MAGPIQTAKIRVMVEVLTVAQHKDTSLRDGLLIFFLLVVPLLALGAFVFFRRNELKRKFCGRRRSHGEVPKNVPGRSGPTAGEPRNAPNNVPGRGGPAAGAPRNASQMQAARVPPNSRPQRNVPPNASPATNAPPRNVPPMGPNRNIPPSYYESSNNPNNVAVPTYAVRQPQYTPSRPPLPHQREAAHPNIAPARPPPAPPGTSVFPRDTSSVMLGRQIAFQSHQVGLKICGAWIS